MCGRVRWVSTVLLSSFLLVLTVVPARADAVPSPVKIDPSGDEYWPAATSSYLAWTSYDRRLRRDDVFAQARTGGPTWRVNASGTYGAVSRPLTGTADSIAYQQYTDKGSDIFVYDMATKIRKKLPAKVNTPGWEYWPAASTRFVLFMRIGPTTRDLLLYNRKSGGSKKIASAPVKCSGCLEPTWVGETHAIYTKCGSVCNVMVYTIPSGTTKKVPSEGDPYIQVGGTMAEATGDVYFLRTTNYCGLFVEIRRWNVAGGSPATIYALDEGMDGWNMSLGPSATTPGDLDLFYESWDCLQQNDDLWTIPSVNSVVPVAPASAIAASSARIASPARTEATGPQT